MADIDQIIAGGAGAGSRADFSKLSGLFDNYYKARDETAKNDLRDAFKGGVPTTPDGQPDFGAMAKVLIQKGAVDQGIAASNVDIARQGLQQNREGANFVATGGNPPQTAQPIISPSSSRPNGVADAAFRSPANGGQEPQAQPAQPPAQPRQATVTQILAAQGVPNDQLQAASASVARQIGADPTQPIDTQDPQVRNVLVPAIAQIKRMNLGQVQPGQPPQGQPGQPQPAPQAQPQMQPAMQTQQAPPQAQPAPSPFANAVAAGLIPPGVDPNRYVAGLKYRAAALPKGPAQELIQSQVNAIDKATELTSGQRDFNASRANPGLDDYEAQKEAAKASATGVAASDVKEQDALIADGKMASKRLTTLNTISNIISSDKNMTLGFGADTSLKVKLALEQMGVNVGDLSGPQAIQKLNAALASESTKAISPRPAQFEFKTFLGNNPGLSLDKAGNERVIGIFSQLAKRDIDLGRLARQNRDNWDRWDQVVENYDKSHPIKDPSSGKVITTDSVVAPGPKTGSSAVAPSTFSSPSEVHAAVASGKLKSGDAFKTSDGRTKYVP
jgi:hypothetical protein